MRKFSSLLVAAVMVASGLMVVAGTSATAAPYPGVIPTTCRSDNANNPRVGNPARVTHRVSTGGNGQTAGRVTFTYVRRGNGDVAAKFRRTYFGNGKTRYSLADVPAGRYKVRVFFNSAPRNSAYQNCRNSFRQNVRRAR